jgi:hypothetical protein
MTRIAGYSLIAVLAALAVRGAPASKRPLRWVAVCANGTTCRIEGVLRVMDRAHPSVVRQFPVVNGTAQIALTRGAWEAQLAADGFWMAPFALTGAETSDQSAVVWRTAEIRGTVRPPSQSDTLPQSLSLAVESPPGAAKPRVPRATFDCPIAAGGAWRCTVPLSRLDAVMRVKGFTPHYLWDVTPTAEPLEVGTMTLRRGASLIAWLATGSLRRLKDPAKARLVRLVLPEPSATVERLSRPVAEATFNGRGFVQLAPLAAGTYALEVAAPGFATTRIPVEVYEASETTLGFPIELQEPLTLRITASPPRDPAGAAWILDLARVDELTGRAEPMDRGMQKGDGAVEWPRVAAGTYRIAVKDHETSVYTRRTIEVHPGQTAHEIDIDLLPVTGSVTKGGLPLAASLFFGGRSGSVKIHTLADANGRFHVALPRSGQWMVEVRHEESAVRTAFDVTIEASKSLKIELADTEVSGRVISPTGEGVPSARVMANQGNNVVTHTAEADGSFRFAGFPPGPIGLQASDPKTGEHNRAVSVTASSGVPIRDIRLVLEPLNALSGVVLSNGVPLPGARVAAYGLAPGSAQRKTAVSDERGAFKVTIPSSTTQVLLIVAVAGRTLQGFTVSPARPAIVQLAPTGGLVRLRTADSWTRGALTYQEAWLPFPDLAEWAVGHGRTPSPSAFDLPDLAPGSYRLCATAPTGKRSCKEGVLAPGGTLDLALP